ncbi:MAG: cistern family PEP-CTERM protein [Erythrobacter sp.]|nr:cistern family PEP-CTERM protein [Erythrobacter sp.]
MFAAVLGALALGVAAPAAAEPILLDGSAVGDSFTINFDGFVDGGSAISGLSSQLSLTLNSIVNGVYSFDYALSNTGATNDAVSSRVSSFAFNTDPTILGGSATGLFDQVDLNRNYPNGIGTVDVCVSGANCAGGGSFGVFDGGTGVGSLSLNFGSEITSVSLSDFFVRYQSIEGIPGVTSASGRETGSSGGTTTSGGTDVPAPGMFLIFAMALLALFAPRKRKVNAGGLAPAFA